MTNFSSVIMAFHEDLEQEATTVIPALPIIIEAKFGPSAWTWFNEDAKEYSAGYRWDNKLGLISTKDNRTDEILAEWSSNEELDDDDDKEAKDTPVSRIETFNIVLDQPGKNQYNDNYSIGTFKTACDTDPSTSTAASTSTPSTVEASVVSPSTSTLSNELPCKELFNQWCKDDKFRDQAMSWLTKSLQVQDKTDDIIPNLPPNATDEPNTGGEQDG
jgi:hypothetical protein